MNITISDKEYTVCTTMRVPYEVQKVFGNKPYNSIFAGMSSAMLEDQIRIIHVSFNLANPGVFTPTEFLNYVLDHWTVNETVKTAGLIVRAIYGKSDEDEDDSKKVQPEA